MAISKHCKGSLLLLLLLLLCNIACAKKSKPKQLHFYMLVIPQNISMLLDNPNAHYTAVRSGAPATPQSFSFGVLNTFDNPISKIPSLHNPADILGRVQGWYGDCGQDQLTLCLAQTFTYDDGYFNGTFSLVGVGIATATLKEAAIVGGTGDFAFCRGVAAQHRISSVSINFEENAWFQYTVTLKC